jgi:xylulokinase
MITTLAFDFGSTGLKAALLRGTQLLSPICRAKYPTRYSGPQAEIEPDHLLAAFGAACKQLGTKVKKADVIALSVMSPVLILLGKNGKPLTRLITHQDRRATAAAKRLASHFGQEAYRSVVGNLPVPGGISGTTLAHLLDEHTASWRNKIHLLAHLNSFIHHHLTGQRIIDPGNASFTGLFDTVGTQQWHAPFLRHLKLSLGILPQVEDARTACPILATSALAKAAGLPAGLPVTVGLVDTSAACLVRPLKTGDMLNISGGTDVLAVIAAKPTPAPWHITRCFGAGELFFHAATIPAAGTAIDWIRRELFADVSPAAFSRLLTTAKCPPGLACEPHFAGSRTAVDQPAASFIGMTLGTTRQHLLAALLDGLARNSASRFAFLPNALPARRRSILSSGGTSGAIGAVLQRDWPPGFTFERFEEATLRGLGNLASGDFAGS